MQPLLLKKSLMNFIKGIYANQFNSLRLKLIFVTVTQSTVRSGTGICEDCLGDMTELFVAS